MTLFVSRSPPSLPVAFFFFNDTATTEIYTLSLHDALPISGDLLGVAACSPPAPALLAHLSKKGGPQARPFLTNERSEEHTSELQSHSDLVCRLLLGKKKSMKLSSSPQSTIPEVELACQRQR